MKAGAADALPGLSSHRPPSGLWLNLSGGGFRAAIFHYGCLRRLNELGLMNRIVGISATSGGAIVAALWAMHCQIEIDKLIRELSREIVDSSSPPDVAQLVKDGEAAAWQPFERDLLMLVRRGLLAPTGLLVGAMLCYGSAAAVLVAWLFAGSVLPELAWLGLFGGFNWSSQRLIEEGCDGQAKGLGVGSDGAPGDAFAGASIGVAQGAPSAVLGGDRSWCL